MAASSTRWKVWSGSEIAVFTKPEYNQVIPVQRDRFRGGHYRHAARGQVAARPSVEIYGRSLVEPAAATALVPEKRAWTNAPLPFGPYVRASVVPNGILIRYSQVAAFTLVTRFMMSPPSV